MSSRRSVAAGIGAAVLVSMLTLTAQVASATTQTKFYSANATWSNASAFVGVPDTATLTLGNEPSSTQTFGSAELTFTPLPSSAVQVVQGTLPPGWSGQVLKGSPAVVLLTSQKGSAVPPGGSLRVQVQITPTTAGTVTIATAVKQSNNFSGTGNDLILDNSSGLSITVTALTLQFSQQPPSTVPQSLPAVSPPYFSFFCDPVSVQLYNGSTAMAASGVPVTIRYSVTNPGLYDGGSAVPSSGVTMTSDATGLATFGTCASGLAATVVGSGYALSASSPAAVNPVTSTSFSVTPTCFVSCTRTSQSGTTGTGANVAATGAGAFQLSASFGQGVILSCDSAITTAGAPVDPLVAVAQSTTGTVGGTITLTFPKSVVNSLSNNGTPLMPVCAGASHLFPAKGDPATGAPFPGSSAFPYQGLLYDCTDATYLSLVATGGFPLQVCVQSRAKIGGGAETVVIQANDLSDPSFW